jgi:nucleotide-binding universal stress UspA family protein
MNFTYPSFVLEEGINPILMIMETKQRKKTKYNSIILIPTDFSEVCENAIGHGVELAQFLHYKVVILHVIDKQKGETPQKRDDKKMEAINQKLQQYKEEYENKCKVDIETLVRTGNILKVIDKVAVELKANLMIMGTHGKQGLQHLLGSHALKVVLDSPCPVVVVQKRSFDKGYRKIVLPVSNELESRQAIEWVMLMSKLFNSSIILYQSLESDPAMITRLNIIIHQITKVLEEEKVPYTIKVAEKPRDFASQVISYAVAHKSDMIMIITMPGAEVPGFSFSVWDERMMFNEAQIPVMCINPIELGQYYYDWMG